MYDIKTYGIYNFLKILSNRTDFGLDREIELGYAS